MFGLVIWVAAVARSVNTSMPLGAWIDIINLKFSDLVWLEDLIR